MGDFNINYLSDCSITRCMESLSDEGSLTQMRRRRNCLMFFHGTVFRRLPGTSLPLGECDHEEVSIMEKDAKSTHCLYVELTHTGMTYIQKTTVVWLLQEGERVSSEQLFRS